MKTNIKVFLSVLIFVLICFVGCKATNNVVNDNNDVANIKNDEINKDIEISVVLKTLSSEYWNYVKDGCEDAAKELGINVNIVGPNAESDIEGQVSMLEQHISSNCDAIICAPNDQNSVPNVLKQVVSSNIPVLAIDTNIDMPELKTFVGISNEDAPNLGGDYAASISKENANAVIIYGQEGDTTSNMRRNGYRKAMEEANINVLAELSGQNTIEGATKTMEDLLSSFPDSIDIVLCHNDDTAIGAMNACKTANIDDIIIIGFDGNKTAIDLVKSGDITATVAQQPYNMGASAVKAAYEILQGKDVEKNIYIPAEVINKDNAE